LSPSLPKSARILGQCAKMNQAFNKLLHIH
jgi:hypothetical protein